MFYKHLLKTTSGSGGAAKIAGTLTAGVSGDVRGYYNGLTGSFGLTLLNDATYLPLAISTSLEGGNLLLSVVFIDTPSTTPVSLKINDVNYPLILETGDTYRFNGVLIGDIFSDGVSYTWEIS